MRPHIAWILVVATSSSACTDDGSVTEGTGTGSTSDGATTMSMSGDPSSDADPDGTSSGAASTGESSTDDASTGGNSTEDASTTDAESGSTTGMVVECGNGMREADEQCDDGNTIDDDGCDADCVPSLVVQVAGNFSEHTCARTRTGAVRCWGLGTFGRLGYGNIATIGDDEDPTCAGSVDLGGDAIQVSAGAQHTCALLDGGTVRCWGNGASGRLGYASTQHVGDEAGDTPANAGDVDVGGVAVQVVTGFAHTCALLDDGGVRCWGAANSGQLGYGDTTPIGDTEVPASAGDVDVGGNATVVELAAGSFHTCARLESGAVRCWGANDVGQLGLALGFGNIDSVNPPSGAADVVVLEPIEDDAVIAISAAYGSTCALLESGNARCWGLSAQGETGYAVTENIGDDETPASMGDISLGGFVVELNAGPCARLDDGAVRCWGLGATGALGLGPGIDLGPAGNLGDDEVPSTVGPIPLGAAATHQYSDGIRACAVLDTGELRCWGIGDNGVLGLGNETWIGDDELPTDVDPVVVFGDCE